MSNINASNVVVRHADTVWCGDDGTGDVFFARDPYEWEGSERITIRIPRANVPGLIAHLQALTTKGD